MIFKLEDAKEMNLPGFNAFLYNSKEDFSEFNTVYVDCFERHNRVMVKGSHRIYFVIEGSGVFVLGKDTFEVSKNDVIVIKPEIEYEYSGDMKMFEVNFPATDENDEVEV